jgi:hypothetical protein
VARHADRLAEERWQLLRDGAVEPAGVRIGQPDPPGVEPEQRCNLLERRLQRLVDIAGAVQRFGNRLENPQLPGRGGVRRALTSR